MRENEEMLIRLKIKQGLDNPSADEAENSI